MSTKIDITQVADVLKRQKLEPAQQREILEELKALSEPESDEAPAPRAKQQFVAVVSDPAGKLTHDLTGWVVQIPEADSPASVLERIMKAAHDFNASKRGRLLPVKTVGEAFESVTSKYFRETGVKVKTKTPIYLICSDNRLTEPPTA